MMLLQFVPIFSSFWAKQISLEELQRVVKIELMWMCRH